MNIQRLDENCKVRQEFYEYALQCCKDGIEIWVDIDGYEGLYEVSNMGRIKSLGRNVLMGTWYKYIQERILMPQTDIYGYISVCLSINTNVKLTKIHRIVAISYIPNPENKPEVNHKTGIKIDVKVSDLEWNTKSENKIHAYKTGLMKSPKAMLGRYGKDNPGSKIVEQFDKSGNFINMFYGASEASRKTGIQLSNLAKCASGKIPFAGGYAWKYL